MKKIVACVWLLSSVSFITCEESSTQNNFVVAKKKNGQRLSPAKLKEKIGESCEKMLKQQSRIISQMAQANTMEIDMIRELLDDDCDATTEQLQECLNRVTSFEKKMNAFTADTCTMLDCLNDGLPTRSSLKVAKAK